jgi:hypothetical protein
VRNILTDADPRQLGMEAMVNRLERMEKRLGELNQRLERDAKPNCRGRRERGANRPTGRGTAWEYRDGVGVAIKAEAAGYAG